MQYAQYRDIPVCFELAQIPTLVRQRELFTNSRKTRHGFSPIWVRAHAVWLQRALDLAERNGLEIVRALNDFGVLCKCRGRFDEAERMYRRALALVRVEDLDDGMSATLYHSLGELAHLQKRFDEGEPFGRRAWEIRRSLFGPNHPETLVAACTYAVVLNGLGSNSESEAILTDALARLGPDSVRRLPNPCTLDQLARHSTHQVLIGIKRLQAFAGELSHVSRFLSP